MKDISEALKDPIKFKIHSVNYYLSQIPNFIPMEALPEEKILAERNMESFLYFALSAIDILHLEINQKLKLDISDKDITVRKLMDKLFELDFDKSIKILDILETCSLKPQHVEESITEQAANEQFVKLDTLDYLSKYENRNGHRFYHEWNRKNSWLWELRLLRNQITHSSLLNRMALIGDVRQDFLCVRLDYNAKLSHEMVFVANPQEYFSESLKKLRI